MNRHTDIFARIATLLALLLAGPLAARAADGEQAGEVNPQAVVLEHLADSYGWHIATVGDADIAIPLPVIVRGADGGWHLFSSARLHGADASYEGFHIASEGKHKGKIVETLPGGEEVRPLDLSLTKNAAALLISSALLVAVVMGCARWYKRREAHPEQASPHGFVAFMEMVIMDIVNSVIKPSIGPNYRRYAPYLLTLFFFIICNNLLGLIPIFPGGANITGNIAVTFTLALGSFIAVNLFATKGYWKDIFWPDVPTWLKVPVPLMPAIEFIGIFTKPFALMIRLFANILGGHAVVLGLVCVIFVTAKLGAGLNAGIGFVAVVLNIFIDFLELLVAYIQAYVFTLLTAVFIGLSQVEEHHA